MLNYLNSKPAYIARRWVFGLNFAVLALIGLGVWWVL